MGVDKDLFPAWQGDLLIVSLRDMTLYRVRVDGQHVSLVEPIPLGVRARDLVEADDGRIYIWGDKQTLVTVGLADASNDSKLAFRVECAGCHSTRADRLYAMGPQINVAFEAPVAATEYPYSDALIALGGNWDAERLDAFLENPAAFAPGTSMQTGGVPDPERRLAIIEHMKWLKSRY
jgi:cytochrome c2